MGHVTTAEYGSQMLSLGGVHHLTGGSKKEGRMTAELMQLLGNKKAVECTIDGGSTLVIQAGTRAHRQRRRRAAHARGLRLGGGRHLRAPVRSACADEVVVVDDHITGVLTEHQAGRCLDMAPLGHPDAAGASPRRGATSRWRTRATAGAAPTSPIRSSIIEGWEEGVARPGLRLLMTSTTGEHAQWYVLDDAAEARRAAHAGGGAAASSSASARTANPRCARCCSSAARAESLRAGVTENPVLLTRAIKRALVNVTCGGAPAYVWPGGGITVMADVMRMPDNSFGTVPTPAIVAPIEFSMRRDDYAALGGHMEHVFPLEQALARGALAGRRRPLARQWLRMDDGQSLAARPRRRCWAEFHACTTRSAGRDRWHLNHGPIDIVAEAHGDAVRRRGGARRTRGGASPRCSTSWWPSCRCCASRWPTATASAARPGRAPHVEACARVSRRRSSRRWPRSPVRWRRS